MSKSLKRIAISGGVVFALLGSLLGCSDFVDDEDGAFNTREGGVPFGDDDIPEFEVGEPCEWEDAHPWSTQGAGLDRSFRSVGSGPTSLGDAEYRTMELQTVEVQPYYGKHTRLRSIAVASSGMTVVAFQNEVGPDRPFVLKAFDGEGDELWRQDFEEPADEIRDPHLMEVSLTLLDGCELALTMDDHLYLVGGLEGTIESDIELDGPAFGAAHFVDGETIIITSNISGDPSEMEVSIQSVDRELTSKSTVYTGAKYSFQEFAHGRMSTVYDAGSGLLFIPSSGGIAGIDIDTGAVEASFMPPNGGLSDDQGSSTEGDFSGVNPFASNGKYIFFHAHNSAPQFDPYYVGSYVGAFEVETNEPSWFRSTGSFGEGGAGLSGFTSVASYIITADSGAHFSYGRHHVAVDESGDEAWSWELGSAFSVDNLSQPSLVSDAMGSTYVQTLISDDTTGVPSEDIEVSREVARLSDDGSITDTYEFDEPWGAMRPVAIGVEETLLLAATKRDCEDSKRCTETAYLMVLGD